MAGLNAPAGTGTCPAGPKSSAPKAGTYSTLPTATAGELKVLWTLPAAGSPQEPSRTGFEISARSKAAAAAGKYVSPHTVSRLRLANTLEGVST
jgi:hypothetical protein